MRILMLSPHSGVQTPLAKHTPLLVSELIALGCDVVARPWGRHRDKESLAKALTGRILDTAQLRRMLGTETFDVMVVKTALDWRSLPRDLLLVAAVRRRVQRIVVQLHGGETQWLVARGRHLFKLGSRALFHLSDGVLVLATAQQRDLADYARPASIHVVSNPFVPAIGERAGPQGSRVPNVLFVGRLMRSKGVFELIEAAAILKDGSPFRMVIAGSGPAADEIGALLVERGLETLVTLPGYLSGDALAAAYASADVFVFPTTHAEGFPTVLAEAMGAGLPLIVTRNRGIVDHVKERVNGLYVSEGSPSQIASAIELLVCDEKLREHMAAANRAKAEEFAPEKVGRDYLDILERIVG
jgi:glycosyltransferase involved in cell wall biosynthesis